MLFHTFMGRYSDKISIAFWKGVHSIMKEFTPEGSKFSPYIVDPFLEGNWCANKHEGTKFVSLVQNGEKSTKWVQFL